MSRWRWGRNETTLLLVLMASRGIQRLRYYASQHAVVAPGHTKWPYKATGPITSSAPERKLIDESWITPATKGAEFKDSHLAPYFRRSTRHPGLTLSGKIANVTRRPSRGQRKLFVSKHNFFSDCYGSFPGKISPQALKNQLGLEGLCISL